MAKVLVLFYSTYGHIFLMADAVAKGAASVEGVTVDIKQVAETLSDDVLEKMGALEAKKNFAHVPVATADDLSEYDAIIFGTPTRFGNMAAQMKSFLDSTGQLWFSGSLIGKVGSVFTSSATQHGGQETTITSFHIPLLHHGMLIAGMPYSEQRQMTVDEMSGGSPYGATTITAGDGSRLPSENELEIAKSQGKHVAEIAVKLAD